MNKNVEQQLQFMKQYVSYDTNLKFFTDYVGCSPDTFKELVLIGTFFQANALPVEEKMKLAESFQTFLKPIN